MHYIVHYIMHYIVHYISKYFTHNLSRKHCVSLGKTTEERHHILQDDPHP